MELNDTQLSPAKSVSVFVTTLTDFNYDVLRSQILRLRQGSKDRGDLTIFTDSVLVSTITRNTNTWLLLVAPLCFRFLSLVLLLIFLFMLIESGLISQKLAFCNLVTR